MLSRDELAYRFQFHPADSDNKKEAHQKVRDVLLEAADQIVPKLIFYSPAAKPFSGELTPSKLT